MSELITAAEARKKTEAAQNALRQEQIKKELGYIATDIDTHTLQGKYSLKTNRAKCKEQIIPILLGAGYKVAEITMTDGSEYLEICW